MECCHLREGRRSTVGRSSARDSCNKSNWVAEQLGKIKETVTESSFDFFDFVKDDNNDDNDNREEMENAGGSPCRRGEVGGEVWQRPRSSLVQET